MKTINLFFSIYFLFFIFLFLGYKSIVENRELAPEQPIKYSHKIHVYKLGLECNFCHINVEKSLNPLPPPVSLCMSCHESVKTESPEIKKLIEYYKRGIPIPWVEVHKFKDWVYFSHKRHIQKGIECEFCHGKVEAMDKVRKVRSMKMGFCVRCHEINNAERECNVCHK